MPADSPAPVRIAFFFLTCAFGELDISVSLRKTLWSFSLPRLSGGELEGLTQGANWWQPICPLASSEMFAMNLIRSHRRARGRKASRVHLFRVLGELRQGSGAPPSGVAKGDVLRLSTGGDGASTVRLYPRVLPLPTPALAEEAESTPGGAAEQGQSTAVLCAETLDACLADERWLASLTEPSRNS